MPPPRTRIISATVRVVRWHGVLTRIHPLHAIREPGCTVVVVVYTNRVGIVLRRGAVRM